MLADMNVRALGLGLGLLLLPPAAVASDFGSPAAGFDGSGFDIRLALHGTLSQYLMHEGNPLVDAHDLAFTAGGVEASFAFQDRVRLLVDLGTGGFKARDESGETAKATFNVYGAGARITVFRSKLAPIELGAGANVELWESDNVFSSGEWTALVGGAARLFPGNVLYAGAQYYTVGGSKRVPIEIDDAVLELTGRAAALYVGYELKLAIVSTRLELRTEAPTFDRSAVGLSLGIEL